MPNLYCSECGEIKKQEAINDVGKYPGEYTKIVSGSLIKEAALCDSCFGQIDKGDPAVYSIFLSDSVSDPRSENDFFAMDQAKISIY